MIVKSTADKLRANGLTALLVLSISVRFSRNIFKMVTSSLCADDINLRSLRPKSIIGKNYFMTTVQYGGKVVSLTHRPPLPPGNTPGTHFC